MLSINEYALHVASYIAKQRPELCRQARFFMAWRVAHCKYAMRTARVSFSYLKLNGQIRDAEGTTNLADIPAEHLPSSGARRDSAEPYATVAYFDFARQDWRSFRTDLFIEQKESNQRKIIKDNYI